MAQQTSILVQSTTSTQNTGLYEYLLPKFTAKTGIGVNVVAVGTGQAIKNAMPMVEVKPRRVGGSTYQVPMEIRSERRQALAFRWILGSARGRGGRPALRRGYRPDSGIAQT